MTTPYQTLPLSDDKFYCTDCCHFGHAHYLEATDDYSCTECDSTELITDHERRSHETREWVREMELQDEIAESRRVVDQPLPESYGQPGFFMRKQIGEKL